MGEKKKRRGGQWGGGERREELLSQGAMNPNMSTKWFRKKWSLKFWTKDFHIWWQFMGGEVSRGSEEGGRGVPWGRKTSDFSMISTSEASFTRRCDWEWRERVVVSGIWNLFFPRLTSEDRRISWFAWRIVG
jgi:hypothetical protein